MGYDSQIKVTGNSNTRFEQSWTFWLKHNFNISVQNTHPCMHTHSLQPVSRYMVNPEMQEVHAKNLFPFGLNIEKAYNLSQSGLAMGRP